MRKWSKVFAILGTLVLLVASGGPVLHAQTGGGQQQGTLPVGPPQTADGLALQTDYPLDLQMAAATGPGTALGLRPGDTVQPGQTVYASFVVKNVTDHPVYIRRLIAGGRGPGATAQGWNAPNVDWPAETDITIQPNDIYQYDEARSFTTPGDYFGEVSYQNANGDWGGIPDEHAGTYDRFAFQVAGNAPPPLVPNIYLYDVHWDSPPAAYEPSSLIIRGTGTALPAGTGTFRLNVLVDTGFLSKPLNFWFNTALPQVSRYVSRLTVGNGDFEIRVSDLRMPRIVGGQIAVSLYLNDNPDIAGAQVGRLDVGDSPEGGQACVTGLYAVSIAGFQLLASKFDKPLKAIKDSVDVIDKANTLTLANLDLADNLENCHGDRGCQQQAVQRWAIDLQLQNLDDAVSLHPLGAIAVAIKNLILAAPDAVNCGVWVTDSLVSLAKTFTSKSWWSNLFSTGSPVYPYVTDSAGRRAGFLPDGQVVAEIPGAVVFAVGESRFVIYDGQDSGHGTISGYAQGTMTVQAVFARGAAAGGGAIALAYHDAPVTPDMQAQLDSGDAQAALRLDLNGDGTFDDARAPDTRETLTPPTTTGHMFTETGQTVDGRFWDVWQSGRSYADSLYVNGFPISDKHDETSLTDGKIYKVQWFERARFEAHPQNQAPYDVLLGLLGVQAARGRQDAPFAPVGDPQNGLQWFAQTSHTLGDTSAGGQAIARFWQDKGGLQQFGYPLSQPFMEVTRETDPKVAGKSFLVQYFERQRFEYHPENAGTGFEVLLGRLGAEQMGGAPPPKAAPLVLNHGGFVQSVKFSPDGRMLASASTDHKVRIWQASDGSLLRATDIGHEPTSLAFSPDGQLLAVGADDGSITLWRVADGTLVRVLRGHTFKVWGLGFTPDGQTLISGAEEKSVRFWRVADGTPLRTFENPAPVWDLAIAPDGRTFAISSNNTSVEVYTVSDGRLLHTLECPAVISSVGFSPDSQILATGAIQATSQLWHVADGTLIHPLADNSGAKGIAFAPDGRTVATGSGQDLKLWRVADNSLVADFTGHQNGIEMVAFSPDGRTVASASLDATVRLWTVPAP